MKKLILLALVLCSAATMLAQTNRMSYQAVVRNAANELVAEENLTVAISISDANGTSAYSETHSVTSNRNGVISLMIGEGSSQSGNMTSVDWRTAQIHTVITLPGGATLSNTTPVNAVPYAFYADSVDFHWVNDAVADYLDNHSISSIVETDPTVPDWAKEATKPAYDYSEIANTPDLSGYLTAETDPTVPDWAKESTKPAYDYSEIVNTPDLSGYLSAETDPTVPAWAKETTKPSYDYTEITNTPDLSNYLTSYTETDPEFNAWDKDYNSLTNKPVLFDGDYNSLTNTPIIPTVPTDVSSFNNDAQYITADQLQQLLASISNLKQIVDSLNETINDLNPDHFICGKSQVADYDSNLYNTLKIGSQCWMKENLRVTHFPYGTAIELGGSSTSNSTPYRYAPNNNNSLVSIYGYLYNYAAIGISSDEVPSGVPGICPTGWHVPSLAEWNQLFHYVENQNYVCVGNSGLRNIAKALSSTTGWNSYNLECVPGNNQSLNNATGFSAYPAGHLNHNGSISAVGGGACFWTTTNSTALGSPQPVRYLLISGSSSFPDDYTAIWGEAKSVRCIKD